MLASFILLLLAAAPVGRPVVAARDADEALERYRQAAQSQEEALVALETAYARVESALTAWRAGEAGRTPPLPDLLLARAATVLEEIAARRVGADPKEARAQKRAEIETLTTALESELEGRGLAERCLVDGLADAAAREILARQGKEELRAKVAALLQPWLDPEVRFELLWNDLLFQRSDEVRTYRERYDEYIAAGVELDRARHPESYLPGGAKTRPGMVYIPGGNYTLGPNHGFERRKKKIIVRPFLIDRCEVSNADYLTFLESLPPEQRIARTPRHWDAGADGRLKPPADRLDHPVVNLTWRDANGYAQFLGKRLPTEDEWEVAARGKEAFVYPWGEKYVEGRCNDANSKLLTTVAVGRFEEGASPFKVLNMAGNVEEWTASLEEGEVIADLPSNIAAVVVRGGHFLSPPENVGGLFRWVAPGGSSRELYLGFRCAADLK